jgi:hypothetical protein
MTGIVAMGRDKVRRVEFDLRAYIEHYYALSPRDRGKVRSPLDFYGGNGEGDRFFKEAHPEPLARHSRKQLKP